MFVALRLLLSFGFNRGAVEALVASEVVALQSLV